MVAVSAVGVAGIVATAVTAWAVAQQPDPRRRLRLVIWRSLFVSTFVAVGAYTWWRRPQSPLGPIIAAVGFIYAATSLNASGEPLAYTIGMVMWAAYIVCLGYAYLIFPRGWIETSLDRRFMVALALSTAVSWALILLVSARRCRPGATSPTAGRRAHTTRCRCSAGLPNSARR